MESLYKIFQLDALLRTYSRPVPKAILLTKLEYSSSTFKRAKEFLLNLGYPIRYCHKDRGYYYEHSEAAQILGLWFNADELQALLIIQQLLSRLQPSLLQQHFQLLAQQTDRLLAFMGKNPANIAQRLHIIPITHQHLSPEIFLPLSQAALYGHTLRISYQDISGKVSERTVSPQRLVYYRDNWYLDAWCHLRESLRIFWVAGIQSIQIINELARPIESSLLDQHLEASYGIFSGKAAHMAHLFFTGQSAMRVRGAQWHPEQRQQINVDGSIELWVPYSDHRELVMDILRYGAEAKVLSPENLKQEVIRRLKETLSLYEKNCAKSQTTL